MKAFISVPMNGRSDTEVRNEMNRILDDYEQVYVERPERIDTIIDVVDAEVNNERVYMLGRSIKLMAQADIVIFSSRYKKAKGCLVEEMCRQIIWNKKILSFSYIWLLYTWMS
jgi:hypothetical protein